MSWMLMLMQFTVFALAFVSAGAESHGTQGMCCRQCHCSSPADLIFVLDESTSIDKTNFTLLLEFVVRIVDSIVIGVDRTRVGVITYADGVRVFHKLSQNQTNAAVRDVVKSIRQKRGDTNTHLALQQVQNMMSTTINAKRNGSRKVAVVITDGESTEPEQTRAEAEKVHLNGINVIAIGVGRKVDHKELMLIANGEDKVFTVDGYKALDVITNAVVTKACAETRTPVAAPIISTTQKSIIPGCSGKHPLDLVWSVSNQAGPKDTKAALDLIASVASGMSLGQDGVRVGVAPRLSEVKVEIRLNVSATHLQLVEDLEQLELHGARTDRAIEYIRTKGITPRNGARSNSSKYGILVIDNEIEDWNNTFQESKLAKEANIRLLVIGVGRNVRVNQLRELAWSKDDVLYVENYCALADLKTSILERLCQGIL